MDELPNLKELSSEAKEALIKSLWQKVQDLQKQIEIGKTPKKAKNSSILPFKSSKKPFDQIYEELLEHRDVLYVQPFYVKWLSIVRPDLTSAQIDEAACHAQNLIQALAATFLKDTVERLFDESNPLNLESNAPDEDQLIPFSRQLPRMREQLEKDPEIFYVLLLETDSLSQELLRHGYSYTPANRAKILKAVRPTRSQLLIKSLDAINAALANM